MSGPVNPQTLSPAFQQTRHARRIYVGGIPPNYADEEALKYFLNSVIAKGMGVENDNSYILSMYINQKKCFAFVELRAIELATACLDLDGIIYKKVILKVLRANEYKPELIPPSLLGKPIVFDLTSFAFGSPLANNLGMMPQGMGSYSTEEYSYGQQGQGQGIKEYPQQQLSDFKQDAFSPKSVEQGRQEKNKEPQPELKFDSIIHSLPIGQIIPNSLVLIGLPNISSPAEETTEKLKRTPPPFGSIAGTPNNASSRDLTARSLSVETAGQGGLNHGLKITTTLSASKVLRNILRKTKFGSLSNPEFDTTLTEARISDVGDVPQGATPDDLKQNLSNMVSEALIHGGTPFVVGGSCEDVTHSSALGLLNVVCSEQPVSLVTVSAQLGDNRILADTRFQEFKKAPVSSAAGEDTNTVIIDNISNNNNSFNNNNNDTSAVINGLHNPDQQISTETDNNNNSNNINNNNINNINNHNNVDGVTSGAGQATSALPSKYVRFAAQGSQCTIETANLVTEKGGKIVWLTKDIRCGREIADWPAAPEENSKKFLSHACKLFEQALIYAAGSRENSSDNSSINIDSGEAISPLTPANRNTTTTTINTSTNNVENTTTENGRTIVSVPAVHSQSNDSIAEEFRSQLGLQEGASDDQQNTININTINSNNISNTITMFPIVVTIDMNVLQQIDKTNNNSNSNGNSSTNSSVLGLTLDEVLDMARIAGANEHVAVFAVTDYTPDTDDTSSKGNLVLAEILYRFSLGVASRNNDSNNSNNYTMSTVVMEHSASHGSLGYESSNSNSSLDLLAAAAVHHHNNSSGNNSTSNSNSSSNYNLKKLFHYAYQPNTITNNYNSLHNISMDSVYNTVNYAQQSTPTNANRMNNNSEHENMFSNNNNSNNSNNSNNKHIVHMSAGGTGNNNNSSSYNMNSDYYQAHLSQQQQQQQFNNKHQPINPSRQSQNTHNMLSRQLSMGQMSMTNPAALPAQQQQNYGSTISPTHYQQQLSLQQQSQQNLQNQQRFETSTVTTNAININAYAKPFTPPPDITQLNLPQPGSGERNRGSSYGNSSNNSSNYNLNIGISNGISSSHSHSSHGSALNSHVNSHNSSHSNLHTSLNNSNNINNSSISNLNNALLHQQIPTLNHNNALHGRSMSDNTMGSLVHHSNITLRHQNSNFNIQQNNHSSSQYAILQQLQTQAQQQADLLQHNSYNNNNNNNNSHNSNINNSQHNRTLSPMSPLHGSMGRSVHNIVSSQQPISPPPQKSFHQQSALTHTMQHNTQQNNSININNNNINTNNSNNSQQTPSISPVNSSRSLLSVQSFPLTMPQSSFSLSQQQQVQMLSQRDNSTSNLRSLGSTISLQNTPRDHNLMRQHSDHPGSMFTFTDDNTRGAQQPPQNYNNSNKTSNNINSNINNNNTYIDYNMNSNNNNNNKQQHGEVNYAGLSSLNLRDRDNKVNSNTNQHNQQHKHNALYRTNSNLSTISMSEIHEFDESLDLFGDLPPPPTAGRSRGQSIGQSVQHQQAHQQQQSQSQQNQHTNQHTTNSNHNQSGYKNNNNNNNNSYISGSSPAASSVASSVANGDLVWNLN